MNTFPLFCKNINQTFDVLSFELIGKFGIVTELLLQNIDIVDLQFQKFPWSFSLAGYGHKLPIEESFHLIFYIVFILKRKKRKRRWFFEIPF